METIAGIFKNTDTTLTIVSSPKNYSDLVGYPSAQVNAGDLGALFGRALAEDLGICTIAKGGTTLNLTYTFSKGILVTKDANGVENAFAYRFDKLFFLDPNGAYSLILSR